MKVYSITWTRENWTGRRYAESCGKSKKEAKEVFYRAHEKPETIIIIKMEEKRK